MNFNIGPTLDKNEKYGIQSICTMFIQLTMVTVLSCCASIIIKSNWIQLCILYNRLQLKREIKAQIFGVWENMCNKGICIHYLYRITGVCTLNASMPQHSAVHTKHFMLNGVKSQRGYALWVDIRCV